MENHSLHLPTAEVLPGRRLTVPYVLLADDAFALSVHTMKPYSVDLNRGSPQRVFNYRLSRARRVVENAFGILASVYRVFRKPLELKVESTVVDVVLCCFTTLSDPQETPTDIIHLQDLLIAKTLQVKSSKDHGEI